MTAEDLLRSLKEFDALRDDDRWSVKAVEREAASYAPESAMQELPDFLRDALRGDGITRLYQHQYEALIQAREGRDIVLESPTASGKTLCFSIPIISNWLRNPDSKALMIHPMKALSRDQRLQFLKLVERAPERGGKRLESWIYDGDTPKEERDLVRQHPPALLLTNPEMLHQSFLGWSEQWDELFLKRIRILVLDEIHEYRGYFGTQCAFLLRRFLHKLNLLGVRPQIFLASATCANALEHAQNLTGRTNICRVSASEAMRPRREYIFINPLTIPDYNYREIYLLRIANAALACQSRGLSTLVFCPSRKMVELLVKKTQKEAKKQGLKDTEIVPYRAGYIPEKRQEIERGMRDGTYRVIFSTNALEIGIDVGRLDVCMLAGFPDNLMSAWQRIGRAGRNWDKDAFVVFYALNNYWDQFFAENIDAFLEKPLDEILIGLDNEELIKKQIPYLLHECDWCLSEQSATILGPILSQRAEASIGNATPVTDYKPPYQNLDIRGASGPVYRLMAGIEEVGTLSDVQKFREAYIGAVYEHFGKTYRVVTHAAEEIQLEDAEPHLTTVPVLFTVTQSQEILRAERFRRAMACYYGKLTIYENLSGYRLIDERSGEVLENRQLQGAMRRCVRGFWITTEDAPQHAIVGMRTVEHIMRIGAPFIIPCDRHDYGTLTNPQGVYLYENIAGGIGIAEKFLKVWQNVLHRGIEIASKCSCEEGCPRCIYPPRFMQDDYHLDKREGIKLAAEMIKLGSEMAEEIFDPQQQAWVTRQVNHV
ncbi:MAG: DEAD/DEAH box helicase [bacterium]